MKSHPVKKLDSWDGMNATDDPSRIKDTNLVALWNAYCDRTGKIKKHKGFYPVTFGDDLDLDPALVVKNHVGARFRGKNGDQRAVMVVGSTFYRSQANDLFSAWDPITFPLDTSTPILDRVADIAFRNRYAYHQNGVDMPFRVKMEEDDFTEPTLEAEMLGLRPPLYGPGWDIASSAVGTRFPIDRRTGYAVTFVYDDRGESSPGPIMELAPGANSYDEIDLELIPIGPTGCTARRIYRTQIGRGPQHPVIFGSKYEVGFVYQQVELFFLTEITDNTTTTFTDSKDDAALDYSTRLPPARPFPPRAYYQQSHLDRFFWANLREHPWVIAVHSDPTYAGIATATVTVSNTGNGTITLTNTLDSVTVSNYKTKTLRTIFEEIACGGPVGSGLSLSAGASPASPDGFVCRIAPGVDPDRTYVFLEVTARSIFGSENVYWFEAIDGDDVVVDGCERFPNRVMFSDIAFPEEINIFNSFDINKDDAYPITNIFRNDYTFGVVTAQNFWVITGSFEVDPDTFIPDVAVSPSQAQSGSICTRPDSIVESNKGIFYVSYSGLYFFRGQTSERVGQPIEKLLMARLLIEPPTRNTLSMHYHPGTSKYRIFFAGVEVA